MAKRWELFAILQLTLVAADVQIYRNGEPFILIADFLLAEANFGERIPLRGVQTWTTLADPPDACTAISPPPLNLRNPTDHWAVLIARYNCTFEQKVINAQNAFYDIAIIHNVNSNKLEIMNVSDPDKISIISVFITANAGREIAEKYLYDTGYYLVLGLTSSADFLNKILLPFLVIVSIGFVLMSGFMIVKCIKGYRRARRRRMPCSSLNRIPTAKFRKNDPFETCAICLEDFIEGEKLRILPCSHAYHTKCIDPWLTRTRRVCPMCKRRVFAAGEARVESDVSSSDDDDNTPLLRGSNQQPNTSYGGVTRIRTVTGTTDLGDLSPDSRQRLLAALVRARMYSSFLAMNEALGGQQQEDEHDSNTSDASSNSSAIDSASSQTRASHLNVDSAAVSTDAVYRPDNDDQADHQATNEEVVVDQPSSQCRIS